VPSHDVGDPATQRCWRLCPGLAGILADAPDAFGASAL